MAFGDYNYENLKFWCQKVLPQVYDDSVSYLELLQKVVAYLNEIGNGLNDTNAYVKNEIENFDITGKVELQLDTMYSDGRLQTLVDNAVAPDILLIGDSFGEGYQPDTTVRQGWIYYFKQYGQFTGRNVYESYKGGSSFLRTDDYSFMSRISEAYESMGADAASKVGEIIIIGGTNESMASNADDLSPKIKTTVARTKAMFPNATINIGFTANLLRSYASSDNDYITARLHMVNCCDAYQHTQADYRYLSGVENVLLEQNSNPMASDGIHPTTAGYDILGNAILKAWRGTSEAGFSAYKPITVKSSTELFGAENAFNIYYQISGNQITFKMTVTGTTGTNTLKIANNGNISAATPIGTYTQGAPVRGLWWPGLWQQPWTNHIKLTDGKFVNANISVYFHPNGNIYLASGDVNSTGDGFADYAARLSSSDGITFMCTYPLWQV